MTGSQIQAALQALLAWTTAHPGWAGLLVALTAFLESLALVGMLVPGAAIMIGAGALVGLGALDFWPVWLWAVAGAIAGDALSYWLGHHYRARLRALWPFSRHPGMLERGEAFFRRHGGKSVVLGRFVGPVRAVVPAVAGMLGMPPREFFAVNVVSALAWAPAYLLPGMAFAASLELASEVAVRLAAGLLLLLVVIVVPVWVARRAFAILQPRVDRMVTAALRWARRHPRLGPMATALVDPGQPESRALAAWALLLLVAAAGTFALLVPAAGGGIPTPADHWAREFLSSLRTPWLDRVMALVTQLGSIWVWGPAAAVSAAWLWRRGDRSAALHLAAATGFGLVLTYVLKFLLRVPRPAPMYTGPETFSFPSAHATMAAVCYIFIAIVAARDVTPRARPWVYGASGALVGVVAFSRLYLGAHWLSDVLGGLSIGLAWVTVLGIAYRRHRAPALPGGRLLAVALGTAAAALALRGGLALEQELARYRTPGTSRTMALEHWWQDGWGELPRWRDDLTGGRQTPLNVQWAGSLEALTDILERAGWRSPPRLSPAGALQWLNPAPRIDAMPVLPHVHAGRHETLLRILPLAAGRALALRLWDSGVRLLPGDAVLWIGEASTLVLDRRWRYVVFPVTGDDFATPLDRIEALLPPAWWREVAPAGPEGGRTRILLGCPACARDRHRDPGAGGGGTAVPSGDVGPAGGAR